MTLEEIHFNHDPAAAAADALNIRTNAYGHPIVAPEWVNGLKSEPAAYAAAALGGQVTIRVRFSGGPPGEQRRIRAIGAVPPASPGDCLLGDVAERDVLFDAAGQSVLETFPLANHKLRTSGVGVRTTAWIWQVREQGKWLEFANSQHTIYVVLDVPAGPWDQNAAGNNTQLPWTEALDKACLWALGAKTKDTAAERIARAVNTQPLQSYTPLTVFGFGDYFLTSYLDQLNGGFPFRLNCTDCANAVTTFSNLLGCDLWEGRLFDIVTRKFLTLNGRADVEADWQSWPWGYHEICWLHAIGPDEVIYDGCLQLDMDDNDGDLVHVAQPPLKMRFGLNAPDDYRRRLVHTGAADLENIPRRRAVA